MAGSFGSGIAEQYHSWTQTTTTSRYSSINTYQQIEPQQQGALAPYSFTPIPHQPTPDPRLRKGSSFSQYGTTQPPSSSVAQNSATPLTFQPFANATAEENGVWGFDGSSSPTNVQSVANSALQMDRTSAEPPTHPLMPTTTAFSVPAAAVTTLDNDSFPLDGFEDFYAGFNSPLTQHGLSTGRRDTFNAANGADINYHEMITQAQSENWAVSRDVSPDDFSRYIGDVGNVAHARTSAQQPSEHDNGYPVGGYGAMLNDADLP